MQSAPHFFVLKGILLQLNQGLLGWRAWRRRGLLNLTLPVFHGFPHFFVLFGILSELMQSAPHFFVLKGILLQLNQGLLGWRAWRRRGLLNLTLGFLWAEQGGNGGFNARQCTINCFQYHLFGNFRSLLCFSHNCQIWAFFCFFSFIIYHHPRPSRVIR